jgi:hypothetical protein
MGKEKIVEEVTKTVSKTNNILLQYAPLIIGLICLVVCYLLFKKIQTLNSHGDSVTKLEKQFTGFVKEQSEVNTLNGKKFNAMISQINQLSYIFQNSNNRESNTISSQMSPERDIINEKEVNQSSEQLQQSSQPKQRDLMPTSVIQTNFPIKPESETLPIPISTSVKKEFEKMPSLEQPKQTTKKSNKKIIDLQKAKEEVLIEEVSSDDEN